MPKPWHVIINVCVQMKGGSLWCFEGDIFMGVGNEWALGIYRVYCEASLGYKYGSVSKPQVNQGYHQPN